MIMNRKSLPQNGNGEDSTTIKFETNVIKLIYVITLMHTF